jgi:hypothetical protein
LIFDRVSSGALHEVQYVGGQVVDESLIHHHFDFDSFRIFDHLDAMANPTARMGDNASRREGFAHDIQRPFYSGYMKEHGFKTLLVWLPIGVIGTVYVAEIRQNDNGLQNMSGLNNYLMRLLSGILISGLLPCLYCDGIFAVLATILPRFTNPTPELHLLNVRLASDRESIEHVFGDHWVRFKIFHVPKRLQVFTGGVKVRRMVTVSFFILNCYYCIGGSRSSFYGQVPPTLEQYLPLNEVLRPPPAVNLGDVWNYGSLN